MKSFSFAIIAVLAALLPRLLVAQSADPINTERPSFSASPLALSQGVWQVETGYLYTRERDGIDLDLQNFPQALLRYGLNDEIELQFSWPGRVWRDIGNSSDSGMTDSVIGVKFQLSDDTASVPIAFLASLSLPTGDSEFSSDRYDPTIGLAWSHSRFFGTATLARSSGDYSFNNGVGVNFAVRQDTSAYAEWQATLPENGGPTHRLNGGVLWLQQANMQWDLNASLGLNDRAPDLSIGAGFSYRF